MKARLILFTLILTFFTACQSVIPSPTPTPRSTLTSTPRPTATATLTPTSTFTATPTATKELTLEEKFGHLVPVDEKVVVAKAGEYFIGDPAIPPGTKYTGMHFRATGESRTEDTPLGKVETIHLVFRDTSGVLQDLWMWYAGYRFGKNKDGTNMIVISEGAGSSDQVGKPEELTKLVCPGDTINTDIAWQQGSSKKVREICGPNICNDMMQEAYRRIPENSEELKRLVEGTGVESSDFRLVPFYFSIAHGALASVPNGFGWQFDVEGSNGCSEGWTIGNQIERLQVTQGNLIAESTGEDPYLFSPKLPYGKYSERSGRWGPGFEAEAFPTIEIRMKVSAGYTGQLFFIATLPEYIEDYIFNEEKSLQFPITADNQFHTYVLDMTQVPKWTGDINQLRLDPTDTRATITIDYIHILSGP